MGAVVALLALAGPAAGQTFRELDVRLDVGAGRAVDSRGVWLDEHDLWLYLDDGSLLRLTLVRDFQAYGVSTNAELRLGIRASRTNTSYLALSAAGDWNVAGDWGSTNPTNGLVSVRLYTNTEEMAAALAAARDGRLTGWAELQMQDPPGTGPFATLAQWPIGLVHDVVRDPDSPPTPLPDPYVTAAGVSNILENTGVEGTAVKSTGQAPGRVLTAQGDGTAAWGDAIASGDMLQSVYDSDTDNAVDDAEALGGTPAADYATDAEVAAGYQPLDSDLTIFGGITPSVDVQTMLGSPDQQAIQDFLYPSNVEFLEDWGGGTGKTAAENSAALQSLVDAVGEDGVTVVLGAPAEIAGGNIQSADAPYRFDTTVTLPIGTKIKVTSHNSAVVIWEPSVAGAVWLEIQDGTSDVGFFHFEGLKVRADNDGRVIGTLATGVQRFRRFVLRDCFFTGSNYLVDMVTDYTYDPHIENVQIVGSNSGFRWRGDAGVTHTTSKGRIDGLHIASGASGTIRGPMLWLEGWSGLSGDGNIIEGNARKDLGVFETVTGREVSALYLKNVSGFRKTEIGAWLELALTTHVDATEYDIYVHNPASSNRQDFNVRLFGGLEQVEPERIRIENADVNSYGTVVLDGGEITDTVADAEVIGPCALVFHNPRETSDVAGPFANPRVRVEGRAYRKSYDEHTKVVQLNAPALALYDYRGGWMGSPDYPVDLVDGATGEDVERYVQNDPVFGPTLVLDTSSSGIQQLELPKPPMYPVGDWLTMHCMARIVRSAGLDAGQFLGGLRGTGASGQNAYGFRTTSADLVPLKWYPFMFQILASDDFFDNATSLRVPTLNNDQAFLQVAALSVSVGKGDHVGSGGRGGKNFLCYEDPYYNPGNGYTPAHGTVIAGDRVLSRGYSSAYVEHWTCTAEGTSRAIATTGDTTAGTNTLSGIADATQLMPGDFVTIAGVSGTKRVLDVDYAAGAATLDSNADATTDDAAVANDPPTWEALWNGKIRTGSGSPVSSVTPAAVGQVYYDTAAGAHYIATGLTSADWSGLTPEAAPAPTEVFVLTVDTVADGMDYAVGFVPAAFTISELRFVHAGTGLSSPDIDVTVLHSTDRSASGNAVVSGGTTVTSSTTGQSVTGGFSDATVPANSWIWIETTSRSGTTANLEVIVRGSYD